MHAKMSFVFFSTSLEPALTPGFWSPSGIGTESDFATVPIFFKKAFQTSVRTRTAEHNTAVTLKVLRRLCFKND
jgi:hypothetical protein